jgi:hypothetical protein
MNAENQQQAAPRHREIVVRVPDQLPDLPLAAARILLQILIRLATTVTPQRDVGEHTP